MAGQSPLDMMQAAPRRPPKRSARRRRLWPLYTLATVIVLAVGWSWLWYYAAAIADRALTGWVAREAENGRIYACGTQSIGGFPFGIVSRCTQAAAAFNSYRPPFAVSATDVTFSAQVFRPTLLTGTITGPVTLADPGQPPLYVATWTRAQIRLLGLPPEPEGVFVTLAAPRLDRVAGPAAGSLFTADQVEFDGRIVAGTARHNPVLEAVGHFTAASAPTVHPLLAEPLRGDVDFVLKGFPDFDPKPWPVLFRQMQASGGGIEIKALRLERSDAIIAGTGTLNLNERGKLDGLISVTVAGIENIVPLLGLDQLIGQGVDRLTGGSGSSPQGLGALDRLMPGLSNVVREGTNASLIETIKKMGEPSEIDQKPAVILPLRVADGVVYLGLIPLGVLPPLF